MREVMNPEELASTVKAGVPGTTLRMMTTKGVTAMATDPLKHHDACLIRTRPTIKPDA